MSSNIIYSIFLEKTECHSAKKFRICLKNTFVSPTLSVH